MCGTAKINANGSTTTVMVLTVSMSRDTTPFSENKSPDLHLPGDSFRAAVNRK